MSAALQMPLCLPSIEAAAAVQPDWHGPLDPSRPKPPKRAELPQAINSLAFYRKHTESLLRRYLYASMQVGRAPSILADPVSRGWCSSRPIRTFEDAVIFVLDVERCLARLNSLDRSILSRVVLQEYTQAEAAQLLGMSVRTMCYKFPKAMDHLTALLLDDGLLILPD